MLIKMPQKQKKKYSFLDEIAELEKKHLRKPKEKRHSHPNYPKKWSNKKKEEFHEAAKAQAKEQKEFEKKVKERFPEVKSKYDEKVIREKFERHEAITKQEADYANKAAAKRWTAPEEVKEQVPEEAPKPLEGQAEGVRLDFANSEELKGLVKSITYAKHIDEGNIQVRKDGISVMLMDRSSISMVTMGIPSRAFPRYDVKKEGKLGLDFQALKEAVKDLQKNDKVRLEQEGNNLKLKVIGPYDNMADKPNIREVLLPLRDVPKQVEKEPKIDLNASLEVNAKQLKDSLARANKLSSYVRMEVKDNLLTLTAKGDKGEFKEELPVSSEGEAHAQFNLEFLRGFLKASDKNTAVTLALKTEEPLKVEYSVGLQKARYWLAPYMEE